MPRRRLKKRGEPPRRKPIKPRDLGIGHDPVNEQVLIAAAITDPTWRRKVFPRLPPDGFFGKGHAAAVEVLQKLTRQGLEFGWDTVQQMGGPDLDVGYLQQMVAARPKPPNLGHHVGLFEWDRARVEAARGPLAQFLKAIADPTTDPQKAIALAKATVGCLDGHGGGRRFLRDPNQLLRELDASLTERMEGTAVFPFGWQGLDFFEDGTRRMVPGTKPGKMTLIVGESSSGKSTAAAWIVLGLIGRGDVEVEPRRGIYCAWEMDSVDTIELLAVQDLGFSRTAFLEGTFDVDEKRQILKRAEELSAWITFVDMPFDRVRGDSQDNDARLDTIHGLIEDAGAEWAVFDLWKRALYDTRPGDEEQALKRQQSICKETRCHGILLHHLRKEDLGGRSPTRKAIKGSSAWIDVPDNIIGIHRPSLHTTCDDVTAEMAILKQRYSRHQFIAIEFEFDGDRGSFTNGRAVPYDGGRRGDGDLDTFLGKQRD